MMRFWQPLAAIAVLLMFLFCLPATAGDWPPEFDTAVLAVTDPGPGGDAAVDGHAPMTLQAAFFGPGHPSAADLAQGMGVWHALHVAWQGGDDPVRCFQGGAGAGQACIGIVQWCHMHRLAGEPVDGYFACAPPGERFAWSPD